VADTVTIASSVADRASLNIVGPAEVVAGMSEMAIALQGLPGGARLIRLIAIRLRGMRDEAEREGAVLDGILPPIEALSGDAITQLHWNGVARAEALREFGALKSAQLAEERGSDTANPHATTSRWVSAGRVFAVETPAGRVFPAFQFVRGDPRPVISRILAALKGQVRGWELLLWFTGSNGYLGGARPVDLLESDPDQVVAAAASQASLSED
jgi:hypothetical protein